MIRILEIPVKSDRHKIFIHLYMVGVFLHIVYMFVYMYTQYTPIMTQIYTRQNPHSPVITFTYVTRPVRRPLFVLGGELYQLSLLLWGDQ